MSCILVWNERENTLESSTSSSGGCLWCFPRNTTFPFSRKIQVSPFRCNPRSLFGLATAACVISKFGGSTFWRLTTFPDVIRGANWNRRIATTRQHLLPRRERSSWTHLRQLPRLDGWMVSAAPSKSSAIENSSSPSAMCVSVGYNFGRVLPCERLLGRYGEIFFLCRLFFSGRLFKQVDVQLARVSIAGARGTTPRPLWSRGTVNSAGCHRFQYVVWYVFSAPTVSQYQVDLRFNS